MNGEFDIINKYFSFSGSSGVKLGVGDDAAVLDIASLKSTESLVVATDTLLADVHFPATLNASHIASRSLLVNVSDFSAMGVRPRWYTLALSLPDADSGWLEAFSDSLHKWSERLGLSLVGGDTTRGPMAVTLTLLGVSDGNYLRRSAAQPGQDIWVTNDLGRGGASLHCVNNSSAADSNPALRAELQQHFYAPDSLLDFAEELCDVASAAIDVSDGLLADSRHIATQSGVQLEIDWKKLPVNSSLYELASAEQVRQWVLTGGDEYQLLFTANSTENADIKRLATKHRVACTPIGSVSARSTEGEATVMLTNDPSGNESSDGGTKVIGYDHFTDPVNARKL